MFSCFKYLSILCFFALMIICPLSLSAKEGSKPQPFEDPKTERMGYKSSSGTVLIPAKYSWAMDFSTYGIAPVLTNKGWVFINTQGDELVTPFIFDNVPDEFSEGLARFVQDDKMGFFDQAGTIIVKARFDFLTPLYKGRAAFCQGCVKEYAGEHYTVVGGEWGCVDAKGKIVVEPVALPKTERFDENICYETP